MKIKFIQFLMISLLIVSCGTTQYREIGFGGGQGNHSHRKLNKLNTMAEVSNMNERVGLNIDSFNEISEEVNDKADIQYVNFDASGKSKFKTTSAKYDVNGIEKSLSKLENPKLLNKFSILKNLKKKIGVKGNGNYDDLSRVFFISFLWVFGVSVLCLAFGYYYFFSGAFLAGGLSGLFFAIWLLKLGAFLFWTSILLGAVALILKLLS